MKVCDKCKRKVGLLIELKPEYATWDIKEICVYCMGEIHDIQSKAAEEANIELNKRVKQFLDNENT